MLHISATIPATIYSVWKAYNNPEDIQQWNFATPEWHCPSSENDLKVGGKFKNRMEAKDGSFGFDFEGEYTEVIAFEQISYVMSDGRKVDMYFKDNNDDTTTLNIYFEPELINPEEMQVEGWQAILDNFKAYVSHKQALAKPKNGQLYWTDITVDNPQLLRDFYSQVLGWSTMEVPMKDGDDAYVDYGMGIDATTPAGGICTNRGKNKGLPPQWIPYFYVDNVEDAVQKSLALGGTIIHSITKRDGTYGYVIMKDPQGAVFGMGNMG